jgi:hypothetical protein
MKTRPSVPLVAALSAGCSSTRVENNASSTETQIDLNHANYKMIKAGAEGRSYGFRFFLGIIPITAPNTAAARADLYNHVGESVNGKSVALINVTETAPRRGCCCFPFRNWSLPATWWNLPGKATAKRSRLNRRLRNSHSVSP